MLPVLACRCVTPSQGLNAKVLRTTAVATPGERDNLKVIYSSLCKNKRFHLTSHVFK